MAARENQRHGGLVDRQFQLGLAWRLLLVLAALFAGGIFLAFAPSLYILATQKDLSALQPAATELLVLHKRLWPAALISFAGIFVYALRFSRRIAGPVYRIDATLRQLLRGEYPDKITFREGDCFQPTAELLTELSRKLAARDMRGAPGGHSRTAQEPGS